MELRRKGGDIGYFDAIGNVHEMFNEFGTSCFDDIYTKYLEKLEEYILEIVAFLEVELFDWQRLLAEKHVDELKNRRKAMGWAIPIIIGAGLALWTSSIVPIVGATIISVGLDHLRKLSPNRKPVPLERLLRGSSAAPAATLD